MRAAASTRVMTLIAKGSALPVSLAAIVQEVEAAHPDILGSILILKDGRLFAGAAPSLPAFYSEAIDGAAIGPEAGSCGTAAYLGERVIVEDVEVDPRWANYKDLAALAGLRSCWSEPIRDAASRVLGTFAMYRRCPGSPDGGEIASIAEAAHLAAIAIQRTQSEEALTASEARAQQARREAEAHTDRLNVALRAAKAVVVEVDYEEKAVWTSPEFAAVCGQDMTYEEASRAVWPFVHPDDASIIQAAVRGWLAGLAPEALEVRLVTPDGAERWISIFTEIMKSTEGRWRKTIGLILDIDQRKRQELALMEAEKAALAAAETKSLFLANMSHEIRTPLNGVLGMAQLMAHGALDPRQREKLDIILQSGRGLLHLINDILDFSKIEAGKFELECAEFDPEQVLRSTVASFADAADQKGLWLDLHFAENAHGMRTGDAARLRQIASNFISNALKFTASGGVSIAVRGEGQAGREGLTVSVRDTGIGIPREKTQLLFERFSQVDTSTTRQFGGTGLGLAICRQLAHLMGGRVWAESEAGAGSTFNVTLALPWCGDAVVRPPSSSDAGEADVADGRQPRWRILAAEDNTTNQIVLRTIMEVFGLDLTLVANGREAVKAWRAGGFDLILMDVQMPVMDGIEATRVIRAAEFAEGLPRTPIIALSANAFRHQIDGYLASGMDAHVGKPIELASLQETLNDVLAPPDTPSATLEAASCG